MKSLKGVLIFSAVVLALLALLLIVAQKLTDGSFTRVPSDRDARLIGRWTSHTKWGGKYWAEGKFDLFASGAGDSIVDDASRGRFEWGTRDGVLVVKYLAVDSYVLQEYPYQVSADGSTIRLKGATALTILPPAMKRAR